MICVVYLVREKSALEPFLESYEKHPAAIEHKLLFLHKGNISLGNPYINGADSCSCNDRGLAINAFGKALRAYGRFYDYFCFLNSWSIIQCDGWLNKLMTGLEASSIAGCTGSWESFRSNSPTLLNTLLLPKFPNPHIRTNAFLIPTDIAMEIWPSFCYTKKLEYYAELGRTSITQRINKLGGECVVVGANGCVYEPELWRESNTFRVNGQENLMISDNQTRLYKFASKKEKEYLTRITWQGNI